MIMDNKVIATQDNRDKLDQAVQKITKALAKYDNFFGVDISDGASGNYLLAGYSNDYPEFPYFGYFEIKHDLSNLDQAVTKFIECWQKFDNDEYKQTFQELLEVVKQHDY